MTRLIIPITAVLLVLGCSLLALAAFEQTGQAGAEVKAGTQLQSRLDRPGHQQPGDYMENPVLKNKVVHGQVSLCNLVNALWLEEDQLKRMIAALEPQMAEIELLAQDAYDCGSDPEFGAAMTDLLETLKRGEEVDEELRHRVNSYSDPGNEARLSYEQARRELAADIFPILSENQLVILAEYKPCLFNQKDPLNPERVGQASGAGRMFKHLDDIRNAPPATIEKRLDKAATRLAEHAQKVTPFEIDIEEEKARLLGLIAEAMALSDEEYSLKAEYYAKEMSIYLDAKDQMVADHYKVPTGLRDRRIDKIALQIVIPGAIEILQAELAQRR